MVLLDWADIKGMQDVIINAFDAGVKSGIVSYKSPECAESYRKDVLHINEIVNAISDFIMGTNMSARIQEYYPGTSSTYTYTSHVELRDTPDFNDEWYGFRINLHQTRDGVSVTTFEDRIVYADSNLDCGFNAQYRKHSRTFFKQFGAVKLSNNKYNFKREVFVAAVPKMIKYFNKSNTLNRNRDNNAKLINEIRQRLRKKEVKSIQINTIAALAEEWVKRIDPNLHIAIQDLSSKGNTTCSLWRINIINSRPAVWMSNKFYRCSAQINKSLDEIFHNLLTRPLDENLELGKRYLLSELKAGQATYQSAREYVHKNIEVNKLFTPAERDEYIKEACRTPPKICNLYTCDPRFTSDTDDAYADVSFNVILNYEKNFWNVTYSRINRLPQRFQQLLYYGATTELENFEYVIEYMTHCMHVEDMLWKKADEQWYELANIFKKDQITRQFFVSRNTYGKHGIDTNYVNTPDPDTVVDNINSLANVGFYKK